MRIRTLGSDSEFSLDLKNGNIYNTLLIFLNGRKRKKEALHTSLLISFSEQEEATLFDKAEGQLFQYLECIMKRINKECRLFPGFVVIEYVEVHPHVMSQKNIGLFFSAPSPETKHFENMESKPFALILLPDHSPKDL